MVTATSADGLRWQLVSPDELVIREKLEVSALYKFGGVYYAAGQQVPPFAWLPDGRPCGRVMVAYQSYDFARWSSGKSLAFVRPNYVSAPSTQGEEVHLAAGIWNRGNVLVGLYGMMHGAPGATVWPPASENLRRVSMDLGLVVSNDGLHFREPVPNFAIVPRGTELEWDGYCLTQGHAFVNINKRTHIWYSQWADCTVYGYHMGVGLGTLRQDGFGYLSRRYPVEGHFVTCPLQVDGSAKVYVNAEGLSAAGHLRVELLDAQSRPLAGYSGEACVPVVESGTRQLVRWRDRQAIDGLAGQVFKVQVTLAEGGEEEQQVYALYVTQA